MVTQCTYPERLLFFLYSMMCVKLRLVRNYRKCELDIDFFTFIFLNKDNSGT